MAPERACILALVHVAEPLRVLVLRRPESRAAGWQSVTGRVEPDDRGPCPQLQGEAAEEIHALAAAAVREIHEETGLPPPDTLLDLQAEHRFTGHDGTPYRQRLFAARYRHQHPPHPSNEHEEARWVDPEEAMRLFTWEPDRDALTRLRRHLGEPHPRLADPTEKR